MKSQFDEIIDFRQFFFKILKNWYLFVFSLVITLIIAFAFNRYTHEQYYSETSILIKEENSMLSASDLLYEKSLSSKQKSLENKTHLLRSYPLIYSTIEELKFDISYYIVGNIMVSETFLSPIVFEASNSKKLIGKRENYYYLSRHYLEMILTDHYKKQMVHGLILPAIWRITSIKFLESLMF